MPTCFRLSAFQMITVLCIILKQKESLAGLPKWVHRTESCPMPNNLTAWMKASERLNCLDSLIANSIKELQHVYHCMPSAFLNESLEFCSPVTRILNASCAVYNYFDNDRPPNNTPNSKSCSAFRKGCPLTEYFSNDIYKYKECFNFNSKHGCYYEDPNCEEHIQTTMDYTKEVYFSSELQTDISTTENDTMKSNAEQSRKFNVFDGLLIFFFILCCVLVVYIILQRKKKKNRYKGKARPVTDVLKELEREEQAEEGKACPSTDEAKESERKDEAEEEAPLIRDTATAINIDISPISRLLGDIASEIPAEKIPWLTCNLMLNIGENTEEWKKFSGLDCYRVLVYMDRLYDFRLNLYILMGYLEAIKEEKQLKKCMKFVKNADYPLNYYTRKRTFICWKYTEVYLKVAMNLKKCRYKHVFKITMNLVNLLGCKKEDIMIRGISEGCILLHYHVKSTLLETLRNCDFSSMRKHRVYKISILEECIFYCPELDEKFHKNEKSRIYINKLFNGLDLCKNTCMMLGVLCWRGTQSRNTQKTSKETVHGEGHLGPSLELSMGKIDKAELLPKLGVVNSVCVSHKDEMSIEKSESLPKVQVVQNQNSVSVSYVDEKELLAMENSEELHCTVLLGSQNFWIILNPCMQQNVISKEQSLMSFTISHVFAEKMQKLKVRKKHVLFMERVKDLTALLSSGNNVWTDITEKIKKEYQIIDEFGTAESILFIVRKSNVNDVLLKMHKHYSKDDSITDDFCRKSYKVFGNSAESVICVLNMMMEFMEDLGVTVIKNVMVCNKGITESCMLTSLTDDSKHGKLLMIKESMTEHVHVPLNVLKWDYSARCSCMQYYMEGTKTIHRARAMIVGYQETGNITLLKRLQNKVMGALPKVEPERCLKVEEGIFRIGQDSKFLKAMDAEDDFERNTTLSMLDFAGQFAYYACHQVYLSRRAFYILVVDMSKKFDEKLNQRIINQEGRAFSAWSYRDYLRYWMMSIDTYCDSNTPIILVGTHSDKTDQSPSMLFESIMDLLEVNKYLNVKISRERCFVLGSDKDDICFFENISNLACIIATTASDRKWEETIPKSWAMVEMAFTEFKRKRKKMISLEEISSTCFTGRKQNYREIEHALKYFYERGDILYFQEPFLRDIVILDIPWFLNFLKQVNRVFELEMNSDIELQKRGYSNAQIINHCYENEEKAAVLRYMERLGLISMNADTIYVPFMNSCIFGIADAEKFQALQNRTSVLVYRFHMFPYFFFHRLIAACWTRTNGEWVPVKDKRLELYKNVGCFYFKQHLIAMAVNNSSIQIQIFRPSSNIIIKEVCLKIRDTIELILKDLTGSYQKETTYSVGYQCSKQEVFCEHDDCFVEETYFSGRKEVSCPRHEIPHNHLLDAFVLLHYWKLDDPVDVPGDTTCEYVPELSEPQVTCRLFEELTLIGEDAMRIYLNTVFQPERFFEKISFQNETFKQSQGMGLLCQDDSVATSKFDVNTMYCILRNHAMNIKPPTNGWGRKPDLGKRPADDIERIRFYRNYVLWEKPNAMLMEKRALDLNWKDLSEAIIRLSNGRLEKDIISLRKRSDIYLRVLNNTCSSCPPGIYF